jgi:hypothetical protein
MQEIGEKRNWMGASRQFEDTKGVNPRCPCVVDHQVCIVTEVGSIDNLDRSVTKL